MRKLIGPDLIRTLPHKAVDYRDTKLRGFIVRCRASGQHSYLMQMGRGDLRTLGRVADMSPVAARAAAEKLRGDLSNTALAACLADDSLSMHQARQQARQEAKTRRLQQRKAATWADFLTNEYGPWVEQNRKSGTGTLARLRAIFKELDALSLNEISAFAVERWRTARLKAKIKPATVNRDLAALRSALTKACEWKLLAAHPLADVTPSKVDKTGHLRFLDEAEDTRLLAALTARDDRRRAERESANAWRRERGHDQLPVFGRYTDHLTPLVLLAKNTGCRRGELLNLSWNDIDLTKALLTVRGDGSKTGRTRVIPMNVDIVGVLRRWRPTPYDADGHVFPGIEGARLGEIKTAFLNVLSAAKVTRFRFHDLRHDFASKLVQAGVDLNTVRELLGHANITMTLRYAHLAPEHLADAVAKLVKAQ